MLASPSADRAAPALATDDSGSVATMTTIAPGTAGSSSRVGTDSELPKIDSVVLVSIGRSRGGQPIVRPDVDDLPARGLDLRLQLVGALVVTLGPGLGTRRGEGLDVGGGRRRGVAHARSLTRP